jgi:hypothetical protein
MGRARRFGGSSRADYRRAVREKERQQLGTAATNSSASRSQLNSINASASSAQTRSRAAHFQRWYPAVVLPGAHAHPALVEAVRRASTSRSPQAWWHHRAGRREAMAGRVLGAQRPVCATTPTPTEHSPGSRIMGTAYLLMPGQPILATTPRPILRSFLRRRLPHQ